MELVGGGSVINKAYPVYFILVNQNQQKESFQHISYFYFYIHLSHCKKWKLDCGAFPALQKVINEAFKALCHKRSAYEGLAQCSAYGQERMKPNTCGGLVSGNYHLDKLTQYFISCPYVCVGFGLICVWWVWLAWLLSAGNPLVSQVQCRHTPPNT